jgi:tetratricopeptide (TPR) repeat protein
MLAEALIRSEDHAGAAAAAQRAIDAVPDTAQAHFYLGVALFHQAEHEDPAITSSRSAVPSLRRALQLKPDHAFAHNYLGRALQRHGRTTEAYRAYLDALRCSPGLLEPHLLLADLWSASDWPLPAFFHIEQAFRHAAAQDERPRRAFARAALRWTLRGNSSR